MRAATYDHDIMTSCPIPTASPIWTQCVHIGADAAALLPQAFPQLVILHVVNCHHDMAALLTALSSCQHLAHLTLDHPTQINLASLSPADLATATAVGAHRLLEESALDAAATGMLISRLPHLTSIKLNIPAALAAYKMLVQDGLGSRLTDVALYDAEEYMICTPSVVSELIVPALQACTSLARLVLGGSINFGPYLPAVLGDCPGLGATLRSLGLPDQRVDQELLDMILLLLPGEGRAVWA